MVVVFFIAKETSVVSFYCTCCFHWIIFEPEQVVGIGLRHDRDVDKTPKEMMMWLKREKKDDFPISLFFMNFLLLSVEKKTYQQVLINMAPFSILYIKYGVKMTFFLMI